MKPKKLFMEKIIIKILNCSGTYKCFRDEVEVACLSVRTIGGYFGHIMYPKISTMLPTRVSQGYNNTKDWDQDDYYREGHVILQSNLLCVWRSCSESKLLLCHKREKKTYKSSYCLSQAIPPIEAYYKCPYPYWPQQRRSPGGGVVEGGEPGFNYW